VSARAVTATKQQVRLQKLRLFKIRKVVGLAKYELELPKSISIHLVFYISLLELALARMPRTPTVITKINNPNKEYNVKEILDSKYIRHRLFYLVKYLDCLDTENLCEPATNLSCPEELKSFH
jgi:hypothetical protein